MNHRINHFCATAVASLWTVSTASSAIVTTPVQTIGFSSLSAGDYTDLGSGTISGFDSSTLSGFTKFDSSLGTLKEVRVGIELSGAVTLGIDVFAELPDDPGPTLSAFFTGSTSYFDSGIIYNPSDETFGVTAVSASFDFPSFGAAGVSIDDYVFIDGDSYFIDYPEFATTSGPFGPTTPTDIIEPSDTYFALSDFEGVGPVTTLDAFAYFELYEADLFTDLSPESILMDVSVGVSGAFATLEYVYDDGAAIPEPGAFASLLGLSVLGFVIRRRR